jgi:hypothetical protein
MVYVIDSESSPYNHPNWRDGVRIGPVDEDRVTGFVPPFERDDRVHQGTAGEGVAVDADGNVYAAEGPNSLAKRAARLRSTRSGGSGMTGSCPDFSATFTTMAFDPSSLRWLEINT